MSHTGATQAPAAAVRNTSASFLHEARVSMEWYERWMYNRCCEMMYFQESQMSTGTTCRVFDPFLVRNSPLQQQQQQQQPTAQLMVYLPEFVPLSEMGRTWFAQETVTNGQQTWTKPVDDVVYNWDLTSNAPDAFAQPFTRTNLIHFWNQHADHYRNLQIAGATMVAWPTYVVDGSTGRTTNIPRETVRQGLTHRFGTTGQNGLRGLPDDLQMIREEKYPPDDPTRGYRLLLVKDNNNYLIQWPVDDHGVVLHENIVRHYLQTKQNPNDMWQVVYSLNERYLSVERIQSDDLKTGTDVLVILEPFAFFVYRIMPVCATQLLSLSPEEERQARVSLAHCDGQLLRPHVPMTILCLVTQKRVHIYNIAWASGLLPTAAGNSFIKQALPAEMSLEKQWIAQTQPVAQAAVQMCLTAVAWLTWFPQWVHVQTEDAATHVIRYLQRFMGNTESFEMRISLYHTNNAAFHKDVNLVDRAVATLAPLGFEILMEGEMITFARAWKHASTVIVRSETPQYVLGTKGRKYDLHGGNMHSPVEAFAHQEWLYRTSMKLPSPYTPQLHTFYLDAFRAAQQENVEQNTSGADAVVTAHCIETAYRTFHHAEYMVCIAPDLMCDPFVTTRPVHKLTFPVNLLPLLPQVRRPPVRASATTTNRILLEHVHAFMDRLRQHIAATPLTPPLYVWLYMLCHQSQICEYVRQHLADYIERQPNHAVRPAELHIPWYFALTVDTRETPPVQIVRNTASFKTLAAWQADPEQKRRLEVLQQWKTTMEQKQHWQAPQGHASEIMQCSASDNIVLTDAQASERYEGGVKGLSLTPYTYVRQNADGRGFTIQADAERYVLWPVWIVPSVYKHWQQTRQVILHQLVHGDNVSDTMVATVRQHEPPRTWNMLDWLAHVWLTSAKHSPWKILNHTMYQAVYSLCKTLPQTQWAVATAARMEQPEQSPQQQQQQQQRQRSM